MLVTFTTASGGRAAINPDHVASVTAAPEGPGCEIQLASGRTIWLNMDFGKACGRLDPAGAKP